MKKKNRRKRNISWVIESIEMWFTWEYWKYQSIEVLEKTETKADRENWTLGPTMKKECLEHLIPTGQIDGE